MESRLYIVDNLNLARSSSGDEFVVHVLCAQADPDRNFVYGLRYDYAYRQPTDVFVRRLADGDLRVSLSRRAESCVLSAGDVRYAVEPASKLEEVRIEVGEVVLHEFWRARQEKRRSEDHLHPLDRFSFFLRRLLDK